MPRNFSWFVEDKLAGMGYPSSEDIPFLAQSGIKTLVNLTGYSHPYAESATAHGLTVHSIDIQDFCPPTTEQIETFLQIVENAKSVRHTTSCIAHLPKAPVKRGDGFTAPYLLKAVGVHCAMGRGRTGTMLACYLVARESHSADDAISETRRRRRGSIETRTQEQAIRNFAEHLKNKEG